MNLKDAIASRIEELSNSRNLDATSLAYHCGMDRSTIYSILGEKSRSPEVATIKKYVMVLA